MSRIPSKITVIDGYRRIGHFPRSLPAFFEWVGTLCRWFVRHRMHISDSELFNSDHAIFIVIRNRNIHQIPEHFSSDKVD